MRYADFVNGLLPKEVHTDLVPPHLLAETLRRVLAGSDPAHWAKKALVAGKDHPWLERRRVDDAADHAGSYAHLDFHTLHAILGIVTEATELGELLYEAIVNRGEINRTKLLSELGDVRWYYQLMLNRLGLTDCDVEAANRVKLQSRYPTGAFDVDHVKDYEREEEAVRAQGELDLSKSLPPGRR